jgi:uncharacterized membrane protein YoaT (DUF817 family)
MAAATAVQWPGKYRLLGWALFGVFMVGLVLFFVSYVGNSWYVVPVENNAYPPDNPVSPLNFGLFYMCFRGHCKYDLRQDYFIVNLIPQTLSITWAYQQFRTACMAIETVAAILCLFTMGVYLLFLSGYRVSHIAGYAAGGLEIAAGVVSLIGVIIFGKQFRGSTITSPFGWSFGLMIVAFIILIANGIATVIVTLTIHRRLANAPPPFSTSASADDSRLLSGRM